MITLNDYLTSSGKYPERAKSPECTAEVILNAKVLLAKINSLLKELGLSDVKVSSGFRPSGANAAAGGSKKSNHMLGKACDLSDPNGTIDELLDESDVLLKRYGLWQENSEKTIGWAHLDILDRGKRAKNSFLP
jgi:hypothetical protein